VYAFKFSLIIIVCCLLQYFKEKKNSHIYQNLLNYNWIITGTDKYVYWYLVSTL
jgi:hypothetical protein